MFTCNIIDKESEGQECTVYIHELGSTIRNHYGKLHDSDQSAQYFWIRQPLSPIAHHAPSLETRNRDLLLVPSSQTHHYTYCHHKWMAHFNKRGCSSVDKFELSSHTVKTRLDCVRARVSCFKTALVLNWVTTQDKWVLSPSLSIVFIQLLVHFRLTSDGYLSPCEHC